MNIRYLLVLALTAATSHGATLLRQADEISFQCCTWGPIAMSWSQNDTWSNVRIDLDVYNSDNSGAAHTGVVLLTNSLGPGTTEAANEIDDAIVQAAGYGQQTITAFTGLTLGPGDYHLVFWRVSGDVFDHLALALNASPVTQEFAPGVQLGNMWFPDAEAPYHPASTWMPSTANSFLLHITGTPQASEVPEPSTGILLLAGLAILFRTRYRGAKVSER
jgi:hypothetical protein